MVKGLQSLERIQELMGELVKEIDVFFSAKEEHFNEVGNFNNFHVDVAHTVENVQMNEDEAVALVQSWRNILHERREMKECISIHNQMQNEMHTLRHSLVKAKQHITETRDMEEAKNSSYRVRTEEMAQFLNEIPNTKSRSRVRLISDTKPEKKHVEKSAVMVNVKAEASVASVATVAPPEKTTQNEKHRNVAKLKRIQKHWVVFDGIRALYNTDKLTDAIEYMIEEGLEDVQVEEKNRVHVANQINKFSYKLRHGKSKGFIEKLDEFYNSINY